MARHRRDDQQFRPTVDALTHEMLELAERFAALDRLAHRDSFAVDRRRREAEIGLAARRRGMGEHFKRRAHHRPATEIGRASSRENVCQYVSILVVGRTLKKKKQT